MNLPTSFAEFRKIGELHRHQIERKLLSRFCYRYRLAKSFQETKADGVGRTLKSYDAILKVFLSYTAYEVLIKSANRLRIFNVQPIQINQIMNKRIADTMRVHQKIIEFLIEHSTDVELKKKIEEFKNNNSNDIICIAYALRNTYAHGGLTPTGIGIRNLTEQRLLIDLANVILAYCDDIFSKSIEKLR
jgi:hypothetical protein